MTTLRIAALIDDLAAAADAAREDLEATISKAERRIEAGDDEYTSPAAGRERRISNRVVATSAQRWLNAVNAGYDWLLRQESISYDLRTNELTMPSASVPGKMYRVTAQCQCTGFVTEKACRHIAARQLTRRALERQAAQRAYTEVDELFV